MSTQLIAIIILLGTFFVLMFLRTPIAISVGISCFTTCWYLNIPADIIIQNAVKGVNGYSLMAVPFFILMGEIMSTGGIAQRLVNLASSLVGWMRGGLAMVTVVASMLFGCVSGSSAACTATLGPIMVPMMKKKGYDEEFATTITMTSSVTGLLIPPSHNMVIYAMVAGGVSVGALFMAGVMPGLLMGSLLMAYSYIKARKKNYPIDGKFDIKKVAQAFVQAFWGLIMIAIVVIGVCTGIVTATESAAVAVLWTLFVTFGIYKEVSIRELPKMVMRAVKTLAMILLLIATSSAFGWLLAYLKVPQLITRGIFHFSTNPYVVLIIVNVILILMGMLMDMSSIILIATPILLPIATSIGMSPVQFGAMLITNLGLGLLTPPVGGTLFIGSAISGIKFERLAKTMIPLYIMMGITILLVTYIPQISMVLPAFVK